MPSDRVVLVEIFEATKGNYWYKKWYWCSDLPYSKWYGVTAVDKAGHCRQLILKENRLQGPIDQIHTFGHFINLETLCLSTNILTGSIPRSIGDMKSLRELDLSWNQLSGEIPEAIYNIKTLKVLKIDHNQLRGEVSKELGNLQSLRALDMSFNQLTGFIPVVGHLLIDLKSLNFKGNDFEGPVPDLVRDFVALSSLQEEPLQTERSLIIEQIDS